MKNQAINPNTKSPRLFVAEDLSVGAEVSLDPGQAHYLRDVMRMSVGDVVRIFNGRDGAWVSEITVLAKKKGTLTVQQQTHEHRNEPGPMLIFAPIKSARLDMLIEKAVELGVATLQPVLTERTQTRRANIERFQAQAVEAAEQCERLTVPDVRDLTTLTELLADWPDEVVLWYGDETGNGEAAITAYANAPKTSQHAIIIGPEGGFSPPELDLLRQSSFSKGISLGPRILRAETAAIAALALWQASVGDFAHKPRS